MKRLKSLLWYFGVGFIPALLLWVLLILLFLFRDVAAIILLAALCIIIPFLIGIFISLVFDRNNPYE